MHPLSLRIHARRRNGPGISRPLSTSHQNNIRPFAAAFTEHSRNILDRTRSRHYTLNTCACSSDG